LEIDINNLTIILTALRETIDSNGTSMREEACDLASPTPSMQNVPDIPCERHDDEREE
jgi:hypothetical protein